MKTTSSSYQLKGEMLMYDYSLNTNLSLFQKQKESTDLVIIEQMNRVEPNVLEYSRFNTVYERTEHDADMLKSLDRLVKISNDLINPLTIPVIFDDNKCEDIASMARLHRDACRPNSTDLPKKAVNKWLIRQGKPQKQAIPQENQCPCGCDNTRGDDLPCSIDDEKLNFMGSSIVLNLFFMKITIVLLGCVLIVYGLFNFVTNMVSRDANSLVRDCNDDFYCAFKIGSSLISKNKDYLFTQIQLWMGLAGCLVWIGVIRFAKFKASQIDQKVDKLTQTPSDLAIKLDNMPFGQCDQDELLQVLHQKELEIKLGANDQRIQLQIKAIHIVYNMSEVRKIIEDIRKQAIKLLQLIKSIQTGKIVKNKDDEYRNKKLNLISKLESLSDFRKRFFSERLFRRKLATTCAIIEFQTEFGKTHFLQKFGTNHVGVLDQIRIGIKRLCYQQKNKIFFKGEILTVQRAPEPQDLLWQNCQKQYSLPRIVFIWFATFLIILVSLGIIVGIQFAQQRLSEDPELSNTQTQTLLGYVISFVLMIVNKLIWLILFLLIKIQNNHTVSDEVISRVNKTLILQSLNCIVLPMISSMLIQTRLDKNGKPFEGLLIVSGQALDYSISNCLIPVVFLFFDFAYIGKIIAINIICLRNKIIRYLSRNEANNQDRTYIKQINNFYEGSDFDITGTYVYLVANFLHAAFYCTLQPFILFLATLGTGLFYVMKKFLLLRRYTAPKMLSKLVFNNALVGVSYVPVFYSVGSLVFVSVVHNLNAEKIFFIPSFISLGVSIINIINPGGMFDKITGCLYKYLNKKSVKKVGKQEQQSMQQMTGEVKKKQTQKANDITPVHFQRNAEYFVYNHISTLIGFKYILLGQPIDEDVRQNVKQFVQSWGEGKQDPFQYPQLCSDTNFIEKPVQKNLEDQKPPQKKLQKQTLL